MNPARAARNRGLSIRFVLLAGLVLGALSTTGCGHDEGPVTSPSGRAARPGQTETGMASWYGPDYHGRQTASGERYNMFEYTAAHRTLPFGTKLKVKNLENGREVSVIVNDRGPFVKGRILDVSYVAARDLDMTRNGTAKVRIEVLASG